MDISRLPIKYQQQIAKKLLKAQQEKLEQENKFKAQKTIADGKQFDSKKEAARYSELLLEQKLGRISDLETQVPFVLIPSQKLRSGKTERGVKYIADFVYIKDGEKIVEDTKGYKKGAAYNIFVIKRKLMKYIHDIEIREV